MNDKIARLRERLEEYRKAERAILHSQSYGMGDVNLTRAKLEEVRKGIAELEGQLSRAESSGRRKGRLRYVVPNDRLRR